MTTKTKKGETTCGVAVPFFLIDSSMLGHCRKYQPYYNKQLEQNYMLCSETKLPCPLNGVHQEHKDNPKLPDWIKKTDYYTEPID